jgi:phosphatidylglycerophosphate synthase
MTLTERAVLLAHRAGLHPIRVCTAGGALASDIGRLRLRGVPVDALPAGSLPLESADGDAVVVIGPDTLFGPALLADLVADNAGAAAVVRDDTGVPGLLFVPSLLRTTASERRSFDALAVALDAYPGLRDLTDGDTFCRRLESPHAVAAAERDYIRHLNGKGESYFTKKIRRFSVPLSRRLVALGATPTAVTLGGLALAAVSAWCIAGGTYARGMAGALLYYSSMILDCSDGEVARLTLRDSRSGAWLETMVDYGTYFLLFAGLVTGVQEQPGSDVHLRAAAPALVGSLVVVAVASYLRHRVAAADPGQFDEASARVMADAHALQRFARWGRQWIKRSSVAHLVLALAIVDQMAVLLYLWAFGATVAAVVIIAVMPFVVRRVSVVPAAARQDGAGT